MEETGRAEPAMAPDGSSHQTSPEGGEGTLAAATAALVAARWSGMNRAIRVNGANGSRTATKAAPTADSVWAPPEPRQSPYDPYGVSTPARGSASVSPAPTSGPPASPSSSSPSSSPSSSSSPPVNSPPVDGPPSPPSASSPPASSPPASSPPPAAGLPGEGPPADGPRSRGPYQATSPYQPPPGPYLTPPAPATMPYPPVSPAPANSPYTPPANSPYAAASGPPANSPYAAPSPSPSPSPSPYASPPFSPVPYPSPEDAGPDRWEPTGPDRRPEPRPGSRFEPRSDSRDEYRSDSRDEPRSDSRDEPRDEYRFEPRAEHGSEPRAEHRSEPRDEPPDPPYDALYDPVDALPRRRHQPPESRRGFGEADRDGDRLSTIDALDPLGLGDTPGLERAGSTFGVASPSTAVDAAVDGAVDEAVDEAAGGTQLPQRVPSDPDVPDVPLAPNDPLAHPGLELLANRQELSRIATYLRYDDVDEGGERREGFDVAAILAAVRGVPDVQDAQLRWSPGGVHILRLELAEDADPGEVSRAVVRLLKVRMGLAAEPNESGYLSPDESTLDRSGAARLHRPYVTAGGGHRGRAAVRPTSGPPGAGASGVSGRARRTFVAGEASRIVLDHVQVTTLGMDATVEVRLALPGGGFAAATGSGPAVDAYLLRLAANAAASAVDQLLADPRGGTERGRCYVEHVTVVPLGSCEVAVVVMLLVCGGVPEQLSGAAIVSGDPRHAVVRATLAALNRRLEMLLP